MKKRIISILMILALSVVSVVPLFAEETKANKENHKVENQVMGKITSINENYLTINVATPNKKEKSDISTSTEKRSKDDMFTLTGETKNINISKAKFLGSKKIKSSNDSDNAEKSKTLTYSDFAIGDYVQVVLADDGSSVAKIVKKTGLTRKNGTGKKPNKKTSTQ